MLRQFSFAAIAIVLFSAAPIGSLQSASAVEKIELIGCSASASDGGSCCQEFGSQCYPNNCSSQACMVNDRYWRTDGKPCGADQ